MVDSSFMINSLTSIEAEQSLHFIPVLQKLCPKCSSVQEETVSGPIIRFIH